MTPDKPPAEEQKQLPDSSLPFMAENEAEVARLLLQHRRLSELMGGPLPPSFDLTRVRRVLDVGCGPGGWAYEMAWQHPDMQLIGIDKRAYFIQEAQEFSRRGLSNLTYLVQDMCHLDEKLFPPGSFDLIHLRFLVGEVTIHEFPPLVHSLARLCRPGGFFAWTEAELPITTSPACQQLCALVLSGLQAAGRAFSPGHFLGITAHIAHWLRDAGCHIAQDKAYVIEVSTGTKAHDAFARQASFFAQQVRPFLLQTGATTEIEFEKVLAQMQREIQDEGFCGVLYLRLVVGIR